jgi:VWFA-related protein
MIADMTGRIQDDGQRVSCSDMFDAAVRAGVSIYTIDPRGLSVPKCTTAEWAGESCFGESVRGASARWARPQTGWRTLAEETGGFAATSSNSFDSFFHRIVRENSIYYLVGYYSTNNRTDGKFRKHHIQINRRGARVVHRAGYLAPRKTDRGK